MQNAFDLGIVRYVAADPLKKISLWKKFVFSVLVLCDIIKVLVLSTPNWLIAIYHCVVSPPKKCVKGQTVLITGGGNGIGKALAFKFAQEGCNIAIADVDWDAANSTAIALQEKKVIAKAYQVFILYD